MNALTPNAEPLTPDVLQRELYGLADSINRLHAKAKKHARQATPTND
jgi:hypothetical protein